MTTPAPTVVPVQGNDVSNWQNSIVIAQSVFGAIGAVLCFQVLVVLTQSYRIKILTDRLILGVFTHSLIFSIIAAIPFDYNSSAAYSNADYCWWRGMWFASSYGVLMYINLILAAVIQVLSTGKDFTFRFEFAGHVIAWSAMLGCLAGFVGKCYEIYESNLDANDDMGEEGVRVVHQLFFPTMQTWVALVLVGLLLWFWTWRSTYNLEKMWQAHSDSLEFLEDEQLRDEQRDTGEITLAKYGWVIRPLRLYPIVFLVFGLPAVAFFADDCYHRYQCLHVVEFILVFRTFAIYLSFLFSSPRNWLEAWSIHIILAKRFGSSVFFDRDRAEHYAKVRGHSHSSASFDDEDEFVYDRHSSIEYNAFRDDNNLLRSYTMDTVARPLSNHHSPTESVESYIFVEEPESTQYE